MSRTGLVAIAVLCSVYFVLFLQLSGSASEIKNPIKVLIIDTGVDDTHEAFNGRTIHCELPQDCFDVHGHGTHVASVVLGSYYEDNKPTDTLCNRVELHSCRYYKFENQTVVDCIKKGTRIGADVYVFAGSGSDFWTEEYNAIKGIKPSATFITASGNEGEDMEDTPFYPAMYRFTYKLKSINRQFEPLANIQVVGALTNDHMKWNKSNYIIGMYWEPGVKILGAYRNGYARLSGTSQATAIRAHKHIKNLCNEL